MDIADSLPARRPSKLRFKTFAKAAVGAAASGAILVQPMAAAAAPVAVGSGQGVYVVNAANAKWYLNNNFAGSSASSGNGFSEATLNPGSPSDQNDAFDGALNWIVNGAHYVSGTGTLDVTTDGAGGTTVTMPMVALTGLTAFPTEADAHKVTPAPNLNVGMQVYFSNTKAVARSILILQNPTGSAITVNALNYNNLGSDSGTRIVGTSNGNTLVEPGVDGWVTSWQENGTDPAITFAYGNAAAPVQASFAAPGHTPVDGDDNPAFAYSVTIPAGQTRRIMILVQISTDPTTARSEATAFNSGSSLAATDYLAGLSSTERNEIVNWNLTSTPPAAIPTLGEWSMIILAGMMSLAGLALIRRRYSLADDAVNSTHWTGLSR